MNGVRKGRGEEKLGKEEWEDRTEEEERKGMEEEEDGEYSIR